MKMKHDSKCFLWSRPCYSTNTGEESVRKRSKMYIGILYLQKRVCNIVTTVLACPIGIVLL